MDVLDAPIPGPGEKLRSSKDEHRFQKPFSVTASQRQVREYELADASNHNAYAANSVVLTTGDIKRSLHDYGEDPRISGPGAKAALRDSGSKGLPWNARPPASDAPYATDVDGAALLAVDGTRHPARGAGSSGVESAIERMPDGSINPERRAELRKELSTASAVSAQHRDGMDLVARAHAHDITAPLNLFGASKSRVVSHTQLPRDAAAAAADELPEPHGEKRGWWSAIFRRRSPSDDAKVSTRNTPPSASSSATSPAPGARRAFGPTANAAMRAASPSSPPQSSSTFSPMAPELEARMSRMDMSDDVNELHAAVRNADLITDRAERHDMWIPQGPTLSSSGSASTPARAKSTTERSDALDDAVASHPDPSREEAVAPADARTTSAPAVAKDANSTATTPTSTRVPPKPRTAMMVIPQDYHAGENRSMLSHAMPIVEHGRAKGDGKRHCGPHTLPLAGGMPSGENLAYLSHHLPLTDPHHVRISKEPASPTSTTPTMSDVQRSRIASPTAPTADGGVLTPMNAFGFAGGERSRASARSEEAASRAFSPMGATTA